MRVKVYLAVALLFVCTAAVADQGEKKPEMDPKMMEAMVKAGTPGAEHRALDGMAGSWNTKITMWMMPGADAMTSEGTSDVKWTLGGRVLEQRFRGNFMGMAFEGVGYTGYDNIKKQYWGTWMDNMSTAMMTSTGWRPDNKTWMFTGMMVDPMTGKDCKVEERITVTDADHHMMEMWGPAPDGTMYKSMEIAYSRKK